MQAEIQQGAAGLGSKGSAYGYGVGDDYKSNVMAMTQAIDTRKLCDCDLCTLYNMLYIHLCYSGNFLSYLQNLIMA